MINSFTSKTGVGAPMVAASLLGHPEAYLSHLFTSFYWEPFCQFVADTATLVNSDDPASVTLIDSDNQYVAISNHRVGIIPMSNVNDYVHRPNEFQQWSLYDFMLKTSTKRILSARKRKKNIVNEPHLDDNSNNSDLDSDLEVLNTNCFRFL